MKRGLTFFLALVLIPLLAGLYGALHDQLSYTIAPEYFTKFKYQQFGFEPEWFGGHRATVAVIGFLATWWVGLLIALFLVPLSLMFKDPLRMRKELRRTVVVTLGMAAACALLGLAYGWFFIERVPHGWHYPEGVVDQRAFLSVGSMHNMSYLGGVLGLCLAVSLMVWRKKRDGKVG